jgi:serine protease Do
LPRSGGRGGARGAVYPRGVVAAGPLMSGRFAVITPHGVFGANVSPVGADLAKVLKLEKGVLVNDAPEDSPAYKSGLRAGDVIVSVSGQPVVTLGELQDQIMTHFGDRAVVMQVVRGKKPVKINVTW